MSGHRSVPLGDRSESRVAGMVNPAFTMPCMGHLLPLIAATAATLWTPPGGAPRASLGVTVAVPVTVEILRFETSSLQDGIDRQVRKVRPSREAQAIMVEFE